MIVIADILTEAEVQHARGVLDGLDWRDGALTAGGLARSVKRNLQADLTSRAGEALHALLLRRILDHPVFQAWCRPRRTSRLMVSKTVAGGGYGSHVDNALMGPSGDRIRTDLAFTLFLTPPEQYEGGALRIDTALGSERVRLPAGSLVAYAASHVHAVETVTAGERLACVGWTQSLIRRAEQREILWDLERVRAELVRGAPGGLQSGQTQSGADARPADILLTLDRAIAGLLRQWAE